MAESATHRQANLICDRFSDLLSVGIEFFIIFNEIQKQLFTNQLLFLIARDVIFIETFIIIISIKVAPKAENNKNSDADLLNEQIAALCLICKLYFSHSILTVIHFLGEMKIYINGKNGIVENEKLNELI